MPRLLEISRPSSSILSFQIPQLFLEFEFYKRLGVDFALPKVHFYGRCGKYNAMVMDLLGPNLEELFTFCGRRFSTKTILLIGIQLLTRLEKIHSRGLVFRLITRDCLWHCNELFCQGLETRKFFNRSEVSKERKYSSCY